MSETSAPWQPSPELRALLFTDFDGAPADPDDVIADALDGGYAERTPGLVTILQDAAGDPAGRLLALRALVSWADPLGYEEVVRAAAAPDEAVWRGESYDRFFGQDDTFGLLADTVGSSRDMTDERGTAAQRIAAARALIGITDRVQLDRHVGALLYPEVVASSLDDIKAAVDRGIARLSSGEAVRFDLGLQIALLTVALAKADEAAGSDAMRRLAAARPGSRALRELADATGSSMWLL
ncbi:hypothetical protein [Streptomyces sp. NPDC002205]|uniref:hypothetical protein n=1 Tax=unclassified Streptomyces TaxID=2593676 RepID=UPI0033306506